MTIPNPIDIDKKNKKIGQPIRAIFSDYDGTPVLQALQGIKI
jgi:hypothetical protein